MPKRYEIREVLFEVTVEEHTEGSGDKPNTRLTSSVPVAIGRKLFTNDMNEIHPVTHKSRKWNASEGLHFRPFSETDLDGCIDMLWTDEDGNTPYAMQ